MSFINPKIADVSYNINPAPSPISGKATVTVDNSDNSPKISGSVDSIDPFILNFEVASGKWNQKIQSKIMEPLVALIANLCIGILRDKIKAYKLPSVTVPEIPVNAEDFSATVQVKKLDLETYNGMLMASGDLEVKV